MFRKNWHVCVLVTLACSAGCSGDDGPGLPIGTGGSSGGEPPNTGGNASTTGGSPSTNTGGNANVTGGTASSTGGTATTGGAVASGGTGGSSTGGTGANTGGKDNSGGTSSGGTSSGGAGSGGKGGTGMSTGGNSTGGKGNTGGSSTGGKGNTGGVSSGGTTTGGKSGTGGSTTGGSATGGTGGGNSCPEVNTQLCGMTAQHNTARANDSPAPTTPLPTMSWDATVAAAAQSWADQCMFSHNAGSYGQNLYASSGNNPPSPKAVVDSWVAEVSDYNYANNSCSGVCGHYTQVVWRNSTLLGCGIKTCTTNSPFGGSGTWHIVVCNYSPPGNFNNQKPY